MKTLYSIVFYALIVGLLVTTSSCESDDPSPSDEIDIRTDGFLIVGQTSSQTNVVKYLEDLPTPGSTIDMTTDVTDFQTFFPRSIYDGFIYDRRSTGSGFAKYGVNQNGKIEEISIIQTIATNSFTIAVRDADLGVFHDRATPNEITVFNPATFEITDRIDMSAALVPGDIDQRYNKFIFRGDDVFGIIRGEDGTHFPTFTVHQANLSSNSYTATTQRHGNGISSIQTFNWFGQGVTDSQGNIYIPDAGNFEGAGIPASLNKIPAGSNEFDTTYNFFPALVLNPENVFLPTFNTFKITAGTKAVARVNATTPQEAIDIVISAGGIENLSDAQINQILDILFSAETARWCEIDLLAKTVSPIDGIPAVGALTGGDIFRVGNIFYLPVPTTTEQAYYSFDITTGSSAKAFTISGADLSGGYNLSVNN